MAFDIDYGVTEDTIKDGLLLLEGHDKQRLAVRFSMREYREEGKPRSDIHLICEKDKKDWLEDLAAKIEPALKDRPSRFDCLVEFGTINIVQTS